MCWWKTFRNPRKGGEVEKKKKERKGKRGEKREERLLPRPLSHLCARFFFRY
jgi:hypothetical protein